MENNQVKIRLNKYLSQIGYCSRRNADKLITEGKVNVNGKIAELGTKVISDDKIVVEGVLIKKGQKDMVYIALNKPKGIVCTTDESIEKNNIISFINYHKRIFPIGRLDKNTEGLILLTNEVPPEARKKLLAPYAAVKDIAYKITL